MKVEEIRSMTPEQLQGAELNLRQELFETRMSKATGELKDSMLMRHLRRDLARILTIKQERGAAEPQPAMGQEN
jgi:large subunit ribosomal protein L29